jgi:serine/threonine-protein kinase
MAAVWAGTNERTGKRVALKVILQSLASRPAARELFHSEGLAASRVNHPNVVTVFDVIEHEGMACMVMELLDGEPLNRLIERRGFLTLHEATWLLLPAMRGVAAVHAQGVIHRDLKPQNIFLCVEPDGRIVTTKVLDFGISILMERVLDLSRGLFLGTPNYMSPEHLAGAAVIDGRADVYGFGLVLYEALTGQMAFPGDPGPALFETIANQPASPLTSLRPDLSDGMVSIIDKAMAKHPDERFANLNEMITAIEVELLAIGLGGPSPNALPAPSDLEADSVARQPASAPEAAAADQGTMLLYTRPEEALDGGSPRSTNSAEAGPKPRDGTARTTVVNVGPGFFARLVGGDWGLRLGWKVGLATALGGVLVIAVWRAMNSAAPPDLATPRANAEAVRGSPTILPLAAPEPVAEPAAAAMPEPMPPAPEVVPETPTAVAEPEPVGRARAHMGGSADRERVASRRSATKKSRTSAVYQTAFPESAAASRTSPTARSPNRAGSLSADDF